jgi:flagellar motor switch protein FliM
MTVTAVRPYAPPPGGTLSKKTRRALFDAHAAFAASAPADIAERVGFPLKLEFRALDLLGGEALGGGRGAALVVPLSLSPGDARGFAALEIPLAQAVLDASFGGAGRPRPESTGVTAVEQKVAEGFLDVFLSRLNSLWETFSECTFALADDETSRASRPNPEETYLTAGFHVRIGECQGRLEVDWPLAFVKPLIAGLEKSGENAPPLVEDPKLHPVLRRKMDGVVVSVRACLADALVPLREMADLEPGDVLNVGRLSADAYVRADAVPVFRGQAGVLNGRYAVRVSALQGPEGRKSA